MLVRTVKIITKTESFKEESFVSDEIEIPAPNHAKICYFNVA